MTGERAPLPESRRLLLASAAALSLGSLGGLIASAGRLPLNLAVVAGVAVAVLAVIGLPSLGADRAALAVQAAGLVALVRTLAAPGSDPTWVLGWVVGVVATLVLAVGLDARTRPLRTSGGDPAAAGAGRLRPAGPSLPADRWVWRSARAVGAVSLVVILITLLLGPAVASRASEPEPGNGGDADPSRTAATLLASETLDMSTRPALTDEVLMTVRAARPTFWRGQLFDTWDGRTWSRSDPEIIGMLFAEDGTRDVLAAADDLGARGGEVLRQTFTVVAPAATVVFAAPSPTTVDSRSTLAQRRDGTVLTSPLGTGGSYTVESRRFPVTADQLRAAEGSTPADIRERYAAPPVATERTIAAAEAAVAGAATTYDKVLALEAWMGRTTEYSIDAPTAPPGADVVDDFLFVQKRGWCEQIASSLVVMLRAVGIPARLATGFVPEGRNQLTGTYTVRARQAHAWAEVWFPGVGWQSFDPTAEVPLAGDAADGTTFERLSDGLLPVVVALAALAVAVVAARFLRRRWAARSRPRGWAAEALVVLEGIGAGRERPRGPGETATAYGAALSRLLDEPALATAGQRIDDDRYRAAPLDEAARATTMAALHRVRSEVGDGARSRRRVQGSRT